MSGRARLLTAGFVAALVLVVAPVANAGETGTDLQSVRNRIETLNGQAGSVASERTAMAAEIRATKRRMDEVLASMASLRSQILDLQVSIAGKQHALMRTRTELSVQYQTLALTRSDLDVARTNARTFARESYMGAHLGLPTMALTAAEWNDIGVGLVYMDQVSADGEATVVRFETLLTDEEHEEERISAREDSLVTDVADLEAEQDHLAVLEAEMQRTGDALQEEYRRQLAILTTYDARIGEIEGEIASLEKEEASIVALIKKRAMEAAALSAAAPGTLVRPVPGAITSGFGPRVHPIYGYTRMHNGLDMNAAMGQPIVAAADGTVFFAEVKGGYGNSIMIDHGGGMVTLYAHQSRFAVGVGTRVTAGQVIGYAGSTGVSTGPHLHFEVRINGKPVNPVKYF